MNSRRSTTAHAMTKYTIPAGSAASTPTRPQSHRRRRLFRRSSSSCGGAPGGGGAGTMLDVTQSWTLRLQHVVVPMTAQQMSGRTSWSRIVRVRCVAGQQMAAQETSLHDMKQGGGK